MDKLSPFERSRIMRRVRTKDTAPEIAVRKLAHRVGLRFRLHREDLPGKPDIVFPRYKTAIFVHGCFWHRHSGCKRATIPKTRVEFWENKLSGNVARDLRNEAALRALGWKAVVIWECESRVDSVVLDRLRAVAGDASLSSKRR